MSVFALSCLILSIIIYTGYTSYIRIKYKPDCISQSYYLLQNGNIFTMCIIAISFLTFPAWVEISPICFQFLPFLSVVALMLVGLCPKYLGQDRMPHIAGASVTCILSIVWNIVSETLLIPALLLIVLILLFAFNIRDKLFWIECLAFLNIYSSIIIKASLVL